MRGNDLTLETSSGVCPRSLVTAILESRRAYQLAMQLAKQLLGADLSLPRNASNTLIALPTLTPTPARLGQRMRASNLRFSVRPRTARHGLRLVLPAHVDVP